MDEKNYYIDNISEIITGYITIDNTDIFSELTINEDGIIVKIIDFNGKQAHLLFNSSIKKPIKFTGSTSYYLLFGLNLKEAQSMRIKSNEVIGSHIFSVQGFLHTREFDIDHKEFYSISIYGEGIKKWSGSTLKIGNIIKNTTNHILPDDEDLIEFEKSIIGVGTIGLYNSYRYGGINGLHSFGLEIEPHIKLTFEQPVNLGQVIDIHTDLYMLLRFFIGNSMSISDVKVMTTPYHNMSNTHLYIPEKKAIKINYRNTALLPYSQHDHRLNDYNFPDSIWDNYFSPQHKDLKELLKKYVTYSMINNDEEQFLGFYRIIETMTLEKSHFVNENDLDILLKRSRLFLSKKFPGSQISKFIRAIKKANTEKNNTERCIHHFISDLPKMTSEILRLGEINITEICNSRNKIIHQPLFIETPENIHTHKSKVETLTKLALLIKLGVPTSMIDKIAYFLL